MSQSISRSFPGGPGKRAEVPVATVSERMKRVEEIEGQVAERRRYLQNRARWHRVKTGLLVSAVLAAGAGLYASLHDGPAPDESPTATENIQDEVARSSTSNP